MIKAIFEQEFLELSERIDNTLELTNYIIGSRYSSTSQLSNTFIQNLFNGSYLLSDTRQTSSYPLYSIWEKDDKLLRICIEIDDSEKEKLVEPTNEYDFIYCYAVYPDGSEKIAIVLVSLEDDGLTLAPLDLNISYNLIELRFPDKVVSTITNSMDSDTEFLEGIGIISGVNMFNIPESSGKTEQIPTIKSYNKYLRNTLTAGSSISLQYNDINGEKVYGNTYRKIFKSITLSSLNSVDNLDPGGGYIRLLGKVTYDVYKYVNSYNITLYSQDNKCDIINFPYIDIIVQDNTGMDLELWEEKKKIKYGPNTGDNELSATIKLQITNTEGEVIESNSLVLIQSSN